MHNIMTRWLKKAKPQPQTEKKSLNSDPKQIHDAAEIEMGFRQLDSDIVLGKITAQKRDEVVTSILLPRIIRLEEAMCEYQSQSAGRPGRES